MTLEGLAQQGAAVLGTARHATSLDLDGISIVPNAEGRFLIGFDRDAAEVAHLKFANELGATETIEISVQQREFETRRIAEKLPRGSVELVTPAEWFDIHWAAELDDEVARLRDARQAVAPSGDRIADEAALKKAALATLSDNAGWLQSWQAPARGKISSKWGSRRILDTPNGPIERTHYGIDIAAFTGTPVVSPADGVVVLAEPDMYFEGGCVMIDHGQNLISSYLHMSKLLVEKGQSISAQSPVGEVGAKGRATGPHLCWRLSWRDRHLDPSLLIGGVEALQR